MDTAKRCAKCALGEIVNVEGVEVCERCGDLPKQRTPEWMLRLKDAYEHHYYHGGIEDAESGERIAIADEIAAINTVCTTALPSGPPISEGSGN